MVDDDFPEFCEQLSATFDVITRGRTAPSDTAAAMMFSDLAAYPLVAVLRALALHRSDPDRGRFAPATADVVFQIRTALSTDGRPGPEEAWGIAMCADDEAVTTVWTDEMAEAFAVSRPLLRAGDGVAARRTFIEAYARMVSAARMTGRRMAWRPSYGTDDQQRNRAIEEAVRAGRIVPGTLPNPGGCRALEGKNSPLLQIGTGKKQTESLSSLLAAAPESIRGRLTEQLASLRGAAQVSPLELRARAAKEAAVQAKQRARERIRAAAGDDVLMRLEREQAGLADVHNVRLHRR
jgi:hypothetical protein